MEVNEVSGIDVDSAMKVHSALGPGLLESALGSMPDSGITQEGLASRIASPDCCSLRWRDFGRRL